MKRIFDKAFATMRTRKWEKIYVLVDVHEVIMAPNYNGASDEIYPNCIFPLSAMSKDPRFCLIMWTCSGQDHIKRYREMFAEFGINFDYANENPEVTHERGYGDYTKKLYANILLDDKAGFDYKTDWYEIAHWLFLNNIVDVDSYKKYAQTQGI